MDYKWHYDRLIETRKVLCRSKKDGNYYEIHHIIPRCKDGDNSEENLIHLTAREHFLAHWLLWRIYRDRQTALAFNAMLRIGRGQKRITSSRSFQEAREAASFAQKGKKLRQETINSIIKNNARTGKPNWNSGKKWEKSKVECSKCGEYTSIDHNKRWHEENCQLEEFTQLLKLHTRKEICILKNISNVKLQYWVNKIKNYDKNRP
jgi:ribosomal protein S27AE